MERLGETVEFGHVLVGLLERADWDVTERPLLGGVLLIAVGHGTAVQALGDDYAEAAGALFERALALKTWRRRLAA